jgi:hypothetical protein
VAAGKEGGKEEEEEEEEESAMGREEGRGTGVIAILLCCEMQ